MLLSAKIDVDGVAVPVILRNLSAEGALIEGQHLPLEGSNTRFTRNELSVSGRIIWVEGRYAGVAFDRRLEREEMLRQVPQPRQRVEAKFRRPGLTSSPLSEADRQMIQMWSAPTAFRDR